MWTTSIPEERQAASSLEHGSMAVRSTDTSLPSDSPKPPGSRLVKHEKARRERHLDRSMVRERNETARRLCSRPLRATASGFHSIASDLAERGEWSERRVRINRLCTAAQAYPCPCQRCTYLPRLLQARSTNGFALPFSRTTADSQVSLHVDHDEGCCGRRDDHGAWFCLNACLAATSGAKHDDDDDSSSVRRFADPQEDAVPARPC